MIDLIDLTLFHKFLFLENSFQIFFSDEISVSFIGMVLHMLLRRNYDRKLQVGIKFHDLHFFKGVILLCQGIIERR